MEFSYILPNSEFKKDIKRQKELRDIKVYCKCGHSITIPAFVDSMIYSYCGTKVINNTKEHFKYKIRKMINDR